MTRNLITLLALLLAVFAAACGAPEMTGEEDSELLPPHPTCPYTSTICGTKCTSLKTDPANCGFCGHACAAGQICSNGACAACSNNAQCGTGHYCEHPFGQCNAGGSCVVQPTGLCGGIGGPVYACGCDGLTYPHPCIAAENGVSLASAGKCP